MLFWYCCFFYFVIFLGIWWWMNICCVVIVLSCMWMISWNGNVIWSMSCLFCISRLKIIGFFLCCGSGFMLLLMGLVIWLSLIGCCGGWLVSFWWFMIYFCVKLLNNLCGIICSIRVILMLRFILIYWLGVKKCILFIMLFLMSSIG